MNAHTAEWLARDAHKDQVEHFTGDPYHLHLARVVALLGPDASDEMTAVAWLHDTLEDTTTTKADLKAHGFSHAVIWAVTLLTRRKGVRLPYADYIDDIVASGSDIAFAVKLADIKDHLRPSPYLPEHKRRRYEDALRRLTAPTL